MPVARRVTMPVTTACPVCGSSFTPSGRGLYCSDACRSAAYRRRRAAVRPLVAIPSAARRMPLTVYECDCGSRAVGAQRCADCSSFMRRLGPGGACPCCDETITVAELLGVEVGA
jgi:hypothetical protein